MNLGEFKNGVCARRPRYNLYKSHCEGEIHENIGAGFRNQLWPSDHPSGLLNYSKCSTMVREKQNFGRKEGMVEHQDR